LQTTTVEVSLSHDLPKLLEAVPEAVTALVWYMHDGAQGQFSRAVRGVLCESFLTEGQVQADSLLGLHAHLT
jgi:hypothetical protein